ncbi:aldehyde dehydrogenase (NADP(+)) [Pseudomonas aeruginosa]|uniref:aldehyde dehydrogenase (NADP(+)) n=1 Tax=Pseudomonas aeruginosa TaxID=287 RepID=UPI00227B70A6|nr:aldehyde dehydrogenase (NADP(+)) [Pseudomonas aeruginosa]WAJ87900.1 aldehyde dehydrogenase (NADP(+)) [Pseudomonas aeruginosa]HCE6623387.1 aldehyde dehydrogenase (NADP(+)) [Pseudomonas aeruginosa]
MPISGQILVGQTASFGANGQIWGINAATGEKLEPGFGGATKDDLERACALASEAFNTYRETSLETRATFLETVAANILDIGDELIERCMAETGLPRARVEGERGRTVGQLCLFAAVVREGSFLDARIDPALPERKPLPRVDLRLRNIALGPVAVFGASNFPLAFSVAGGDTASALAAGCPVIVKAHSAHPGTAELVGRAVQKAVDDCGLPEGVFSLLFDSGRDVGQGLVADRRIKAVGFTGSRTGGTALMHIAAARPEPIPVYAEMSSINPVILMPHALTERGADIGKAFVASLTMGAGQFCTNPGLVIAIEGEGLEAFIAGASDALSNAAAQTMLSPGIFRSYCQGVTALQSHPSVTALAAGRAGETNQGQAALFSTSASDFLAHHELREEVFGAASLIVRCQNITQVQQVIKALEGQLIAALHIAGGDHILAQGLIPTLELKVGRILVNGFGTGVEVCHAMVHGGPFPATSDSRTTSVGSLAISRFLRPVSYQDLPQELLPVALRDANAYGIRQRINGVLTGGNEPQIVR